MARFVLAFVTAFLLSSCTAPDYEAMQAHMAKVAAAEARQRLASAFFRQFNVGVDSVLAGLAAEGGFLDNPLVKILLPPPLGLLVDVGQAFHNDPQAALLDTLLNQAATNAVPGASGILKAAVQDIVLSGDAEQLFYGNISVSDYLKEQTGQRLQKRLKPAVRNALANNGADKLYRELSGMAAIVNGMGDELDETQTVSFWEDGAATAEEVASVPPGKLDDYVTAKAVDGIFKALAAKEAQLREQMASDVGFSF